MSRKPLIAGARRPSVSWIDEWVDEFLGERCRTKLSRLARAPRRIAQGLVLVGATWFYAPTAHAAEPVRVTTDNNVSVNAPAKIAMDADGDFVVVWEGYYNYDIHARKYNAAGVAVSGDIVVATDKYDYFGPAVAMDADGDFVVTWRSTDYYVKAKRFNAAGVPQGSVLDVGYSYEIGAGVDVDMDADGDFVVSWESYDPITYFREVHARRFSNAGVDISGEVVVTQDKDYTPASVACDSDGDFVVAWQAYNTTTGGIDILARRFNAAGVAVTGNLGVAGGGYTYGGSKVAMDDAGNFAVAWLSYYDYQYTTKITAQRFNAAGVAQGGQMLVTSNAGYEGFSIDMDADGDLTASWRNYNYDTGDERIFAKRISPTGVDLTGDLLATGNATYGYAAPAVAVSADSAQIRVAWQQTFFDSIAQDYTNNILFNTPTPNLMPNVVSGPVGTPAAAKVGEVVTFSVAGTDPEGQPLQYVWNFNDGTNNDPTLKSATGNVPVIPRGVGDAGSRERGSGPPPDAKPRPDKKIPTAPPIPPQVTSLNLNQASVNHAFTPAGTYTVQNKIIDSGGNTVTRNMTMVINPIGFGGSPSGFDSDGDGFPDEMETFFGSLPLNNINTPFGLTGTGNFTPLTGSRLMIKLNFAKSGADQLTMSGELPVPSGFTVVGQRLLLSIGGVIRDFTFDGKGIAKSGSDMMKLSVRATRGNVKAQNAKFMLKIKGTFNDKLADEGLANRTVKGNMVVPAILVFNKVTYRTDLTVKYTGKSGKTGSATGKN